MPNCVFLLSLARYRRRPEATVGARLREHTRLRLEQRKRTSPGNVKRGAASSVLTGRREITGERRVGLAGSLRKAETAGTMPILGTSSPEPYEWSRFRYCCHNSYVPVVWAYPSSVTGKARNPLPSGKLFRVGQMIAPPAMRDLPSHLASEIEVHSVAAAGTCAQLASKAPVVCRHQPHQPRFPYCPCARCLTEGLLGANVQKRT